jgi:radical SAM superfamily enzyme YgiQ (UPF0313 family)
VGYDQILNKALAAHKAGEHEEAIRLYTTIIKKKPMHLDANQLLGAVYAETGKLESAKEYLLKAERIMPGSPYIKSNLGTVLSTLGEVDEALVRFRFLLNPATNWAVELKLMTTPMVLLNGLVLNPEKTPLNADIVRQDNTIRTEEMSLPTGSFPPEAVQQLPLPRDSRKQLKIDLIYPPPCKILKSGMFPPGTPFDAPIEWGSNDLDEDSKVITYGLMTIAAEARRAGHDVSIHNLSSTTWQEVVALVAGSNADIYGISAFTSNRGGMAAVAALIRQHHPTVHITVGGPFATALPQETLRYFSSINTVVIGEGEETFMELLECLESGRSTAGIPGTAWRKGEEIIVEPRRQRINDLDALASPFDYFTSDIVMTSRGCPEKCTFCGSFTTWGQKLRFHSVDYCINMIKTALNRLPIPFLAIKDDTFTADRRRAITICDEIIKNKINFIWSCDTRVDCLDDELLGKMRLAGCQMISFGVESGSPEILKSMHKNTTPEMVLEATRSARKYGFFIRYYMILLNRGETAETINQSTDLIRAGRPNRFLFNCLSFYPGTEDWEIFSRKQNLSADIFFNNDFTNLSTDRNRNIKLEELQRKIWCDIGTIYGFDYSIEELEKVVGLLPDLHCAHLELANAYLHAGQFKKATDELNRAEVMGFPIEVIITNQRACILLAQSEIESAYVLLESAINSSPCRIIEQNYTKLSSWIELPIHKRGNPPKLVDSILASDFR